MTINDTSDRKYWNQKRVLITGHTGFKGGWLAVWLEKLGAYVYGIGLPPITQNNLFDLARVSKICDSNFSDINDLFGLKKIIASIEPEVIFHMAAQPLVRDSYNDPIGTFQTNVMGTANLLEASKELESLESIILITTDKVYDNKDWCWPYRETDILGGYDPYSASKAACELLINSYRSSFYDGVSIPIASTRAGNVIGGGDWSKDRLIPDCVKEWQAGRPVMIRNPDAIRPWQHVLEPLYGYMLLAEKIAKDSQISGAYNFGPLSTDVKNVRQIVEEFACYFKAPQIVVNKNEHLHEASHLSLDISKSMKVLNYVPRWDILDSVRYTAEWYIQQLNGCDMLVHCHKQIELFEAKEL